MTKEVSKVAWDMLLIVTACFWGVYIGNKIMDLIAFESSTLDSVVRYGTSMVGGLAIGLGVKRWRRRQNRKAKRSTP